jgi:hypothetical protein
MRQQSTRNETKMYADGTTGTTRPKTRRELLAQYVRLQRDLLDSDPSSATYQATIYAFRQLGFALISSGFEDDLDRLLRLRVIDGGRRSPAPLRERTRPVELHLIEQRWV